MSVDVNSGYQVDILDRKSCCFEDKNAGTGERFPYASVVPALVDLRDAGFITDLECNVAAGQLPVAIRYIYSDLAVRDCLTSAGNVLKLYARYAARQPDTSTIAGRTSLSSGARASEMNWISFSQKGSPRWWSPA